MIFLMYSQPSGVDICPNVGEVNEALGLKLKVASKKPLRNQDPLSFKVIFSTIIRKTVPH